MGPATGRTARQQVIQLLTGRHQAEPPGAVAEDLRKRLASMASPPAVIERKLGELPPEAGGSG